MSDVLISIGISSESAKTGRDQIVSYNADIAASYDKVLAAAKAAGSQNAGAGIQPLREQKAAVDDLARTYDRAAAEIMAGDVRRMASAKALADAGDRAAAALMLADQRRAKEAEKLSASQVATAEKAAAAVMASEMQRADAAERAAQRIRDAQASQNAQFMRSNAAAQSFSGYTLSGVSARDSASVFQAAFAQQDQLEAAHQRATAAIMSGEQMRAQAAQKAAADQISALKRLEASILPAQAAQERLTQQMIAWDRAMLTGAISMEKWKQGAAALAAQQALLHQETTRASNGFGNMRFALANAGQQFQDMIIVSQMGGQAIGQMGIQVAQTISGFGMMGAAAGIAVTAVGFLVQALLNVGNESESAELRAKTYGDGLKELVKIEQEYNDALRERAGLPLLPDGTKGVRQRVAEAEGRLAILSGEDQLTGKINGGASGTNFIQDYTAWYFRQKRALRDYVSGYDKTRERSAAMAERQDAVTNLVIANDIQEATDKAKLATTIDSLNDKRAKELEIVRLSTSGQERQAAILKAENDVRERLKGRIEFSETDIKSQAAAAGVAAAAIFDMEAAHKAAEKAAKDNLHAQEKLAREAEQAKKHYDTSIISARDYVQSLDDQRAALSMSERDAEVFRAGLKVEHDLRKANGGALTEEARGYVELAKAKAGSLYDDKQKKRQDEGTDLKQKYLPQSIREDMEIKYLQAHKDRLIELGWTEEELTRLIQEHNIKRLEASQNWADGAEAALRRYSMSASNYGTMAGRVVTNGLQSMENAIVGFSSKTMTAAQAFKSMATSIIQDLIRMQVQANITGPLSRALSSGIGDFFSSGPQQLASANASISSSPGMSEAFSGAFASGTDYAPRGLALVGEQGPELMQLGGGERIYPASETAAILSPRAANSNNTGGAVTHIAEGAIVVNAPGASAEDAQAIALAVAQQVVAAAAPQIQRGAVQQSLGAVQSAANRGGSFAQAVGRR